MLELDGVDVAYGSVRALRGVSVRVDAGELVTLIGANGAGKTTTIRSISGLLRPTTGSIRFEGTPIHTLAPEAIVGLGIVQVPEGRRIFPELTVEENLRVGAYLVRDHARIMERFERVYSLFPRLRERRRQAGNTLSGGEQQMLAFGRALMAGPRLLLLDEPSLGLAPLLVQDVAHVVTDLKRSGLTMLLVEQNARLALTLADRGYVLETGRIVLSDTSARLLANPDVQKSYLGSARGSR
ncbi:MAG: ABC transporter ATP-binding protein [Candidatus Rokuibacteriota bacterium]|nr:MAG: ABC transporter ATP-binding protein [Candidatus Rokubacteria bacterium]